MTSYDLSTVTATRDERPPRMCLYAPEGFGKSTFGATCKNPIFICTEAGLVGIEVPHFPLCAHIADVEDCIKSLREEEHNYNTVVIDSLDWLEKIIHEDIRVANHAKSIDDYNVKALAYNGGRKLALQVWSNLLSLLTALNERQKMTVIMLAHSKISRFDSPISAPYDRFSLDIWDKTAAMITQWCDIVGFGNFRVMTKEEDLGFGQKARRAMGHERILYLEERPAYDAKNRYGLPSEIPFTNWRDLVTLIAANLEETKNGNGKLGTDDQTEQRSGTKGVGSGPEQSSRASADKRPATERGRRNTRQAIPFLDSDLGKDAQGTDSADDETKETN